MLEIATDPIPPGTNNDTEMEELINSVVERQKEELIQLRSHWDQRRREGRRLEASSLIIRPSAVGACNRFFELCVACESPKDRALWKLCLETVLKLSASSLDICAMNVTVTTSSSRFARILAHIDPLFNITNFVTKEIDPDIDLPAAKSNEEHTQELQQLIESMFEHMQTETSKLMAFWDELKSNPAKRMQLMHLDFKCERNEIKFKIDALEPNHRDMWKSCLCTALYKMEIPENAIKTRQLYCFFEVSIERNAFKRLLSIVKPLANRTFVRTLEVEDVKLANIPLNLNFFTRLSIRQLKVCPTTESFDVWLDFTRQLGPSYTTVLRQGLPTEIHDFIIPLADIVETILLVEIATCDTPLKPFPISAIREILSRKCNYLAIKGNITDASRTVAEGLLMFLHHLNKRVYLTMPTRLEPMNVKVGEFEVIATRNPGIQYITITNK